MVRRISNERTDISELASKMMMTIPGRRTVMTADRHHLARNKQCLTGCASRRL
jgi:hypothetical protein